MSLRSCPCDRRGDAGTWHRAVHRVAGAAEVAVVHLASSHNLSGPPRGASVRPHVVDAGCPWGPGARGGPPEGGGEDAATAERSNPGAHSATCMECRLPRGHIAAGGNDNRSADGMQRRAARGHIRAGAHDICIADGVLCRATRGHSVVRGNDAQSGGCEQRRVPCCPRAVVRCNDNAELVVSEFKAGGEYCDSHAVERGLFGFSLDSLVADALLTLCSYK